MALDPDIQGSPSAATLSYLLLRTDLSKHRSNWNLHLNASQASETPHVQTHLPSLLHPPLLISLRLNGSANMSWTSSSSHATCALLTSTFGTLLGTWPQGVPGALFTSQLSAYPTVRLNHSLPKHCFLMFPCLCPGLFLYLDCLFSLAQMPPLLGSLL